MAFPIEIITTDENLLSPLKTAIQPLNSVQSEFIFELANERLMPAALSFRQNTYTNQEVFDWLKEYRKNAGGNRPYIILVLTKSLSGRLGNLYGSHKAELGFAWYTTDAFDLRFEQFLFDRIRFHRYYLVRYILSFIAPQIKAHPTIGCMFDDKINKRDISLSLNTGNICNNCMSQLRATHLFNFDVATAVRSMLAVVSNQYPRTLVMKGGGVKGLALVGALKELEKYFTFDSFAGTSAGAIAATLLASGYTPTELELILKNKKFSDFKSSLVARLWNIFTKFAFHSGKHFFTWLDDLLKSKLSGRVGDIQMKDLPKRAIVYASWVGGGILRFDSKGERKETTAAFATRCSMSIPYFFVPEKIENVKVYDGGLGNNFPLKTFISDNGNSLFIGLYLISEVDKNGSTYNNLKDIITDTDERQVVDKNLDKIVIIDPRPVSTTNFNLSSVEKEYLLQAGKVGALKYLSKYHGDLMITDIFLNEENEKLKVLREKINNIEDDI